MTPLPCWARRPTIDEAIAAALRPRPGFTALLNFTVDHHRRQDVSGGPCAGHLGIWNFFSAARVDGQTLFPPFRQFDLEPGCVEDTVQAFDFGAVCTV
jgi:hypothetical protein